MTAEDRISLHNYHAMLKRNHICTRCRKQDAYTLGGRALCFECAAKQRERNKRSYARHKKETNARHREKYSAAKLNKVCPRCGKKIERFDEAVCCDNCRAKDALRKRDEVVVNGRNYPRGANGICWQCNKEPVIEGKKLCQKCFDVAMNNLLKGKPSSNVNHWWGKQNNNLYGGRYART